MQISQEKPAFQVIHIKLETAEEAAALWDLVQARAAYAKTHGTELTSINEVCSKIHNYFNDNRESLLP
ncbi:MAG: hypothetical protein ACXWAT_06710 [Methylobacter sp.]